MEIDKDGITWFDEPVTSGRALTDAEITAARRVAKQERFVAKALRVIERQARRDAKPTIPQKAAATRKKANTLLHRELMKGIRERLRLERRERLARVKRRKAAAPTKPRIVRTPEERAAIQRARDAAREVKRIAKQDARRVERLGLPPLPY
jgi:hypothetical protein